MCLVSTYILCVLSAIAPQQLYAHLLLDIENSTWRHVMFSMVQALINLIVMMPTSNRRSTPSTNATPFICDCHARFASGILSHGVHPISQDATERLRLLQEVHTLVRSVVQLHKDEMQARTKPSTAPHFAKGDKVSVVTTNRFLRGQPKRKLRDRQLGPFPVEEQIGKYS
jgi:hypothetical protein